MLTSSLITLAKKEFPDWSRIQLLGMLNEIQRIVFTQNNTRQMRMYDSTTGKDPILTTVDGTYVYEINTTNGFDYNVWRVTSVYNDDIYDPIDVIKYDATPSNSAIIVFNENPGNAEYYLRCFRQCSDLTSETTQMEIPHAYHLSHIWEGLCGLIEKYRSGKSDRFLYFMEKLLPDLILKISENQNNEYNVEVKGY